MKEYQKNWYQKNKDRLLEYSRDYARSRRKTHPHLIKLHQDNWRHKKLSNLSSRPRPMFCEVCGGDNNRRALCFDHDHETGKFRGWLCDKCNWALGLVKDNTDILHRLIDYIEKNS